MRPFSALGGYLVVGVVFFWPILLRLKTHVLSGDIFNWPNKGGDEVVFVWMYWWVQKALASGTSLLDCDWIFPPTGANLTMRSIPFLPVILTYPLGRTLGPIAGNNLMVFLMVVTGGWCYYIFLIRTLSVSRFSAFVTGALFGFCPWFVWKAGGHYNMIGACWWATALGAVITAYSRKAFTLRSALLFAVFLWATFWSSFVEFFMLGIILALTVAVWEADCLVRRDSGLWKRARFFLPVLLGAVSLLLLFHKGPSQPVDVDLLPGPTFKDLIPSAKLSVFSAIGLPNRTATIVPHSFVYLALVGVVVAFRRKYRWSYPVLGLAIVSLLLILDPFHMPSTLARSLPLGGGFRQFERFMPFLLFFMLLFSCQGLEFLKNEWRPRRTYLRPLVIVSLLGFSFLELYPYLLHTSPVKHIPLSDEAHASLDRSKFCLVVPDDMYWPNFDNYQPDLDMPFVNACGWDHMSLDAKALREAQFPAVYQGIKSPYTLPNIPDIEAPDFLRELKALNVGYLIFIDKSDAGRFVNNGHIVIETDEEILFQLDNYGCE